MAQHVKNRDFCLSRKVIDSVRKWTDQRDGLGKRQTLDEFVNDPLGEKKKHQNISALNDALKNELYEHKLSKVRAREFSSDIGVNATKR